jgi:hypothetical protein
VHGTVLHCLPSLVAWYLYPHSFSSLLVQCGWGETTKIPNLRLPAQQMCNILFSFIAIYYSVVGIWKELPCGVVWSEPPSQLWLCLNDYWSVSTQIFCYTFPETKPELSTDKWGVQQNAEHFSNEYCVMHLLLLASVNYNSLLETWEKMLQGILTH